ncbi:unnamed protein product [Ostreobium quekettii]|uniref:Histidine-containing phosphotransfer protein n=1 Tax=Ostreobium quekettii TaxID=121088 RepID=A0A8S1JAL0_9CHLO|nr:unnamed protein product [Ostreobium quekettii]|eukprot:evm.model.scf_992.8 EVM.evm.TU.scf_992.8   scf_992:54471-54968(-)
MALPQPAKAAGLSRQYANLLISRGVLTRQFMVLVDLEERQHNWGFVSELVDMYLSDSAARMRQISGQLLSPSPDFAELERLSIKFSGSSATFGARGVCELLAKLIGWARTGDRERCAGVVGRLWAEMQALEPVLALFVRFDAVRRAPAQAAAAARELGPAAVVGL